MAKIWNTHHDQNNDLQQSVEAFTVGIDYTLDQKLLPYDIAASKVHAEGLKSIGILSADELRALHQGLDEIQSLWEQGQFKIDRSQEDGHTAIEQYLVEHVGEAGKKIHTGRSRNDQVLTMMRLYEKDQIESILDQTTSLITDFISVAEQYEHTPFPGFTHTQKAMPSSVGMWAATFAEMLLLNRSVLKSGLALVSKSPLGSAAGYGVHFLLPREENAQKMGFEDVLVIAGTSQNTRGKIEGTVVSQIADLAATLGQFANDVVFFSSSVVPYFTLPTDLCTGSSIMPQKKNVDPAELLRGRYSEILGNESTLKHLHEILFLDTTETDNLGKSQS